MSDTVDDGDVPEMQVTVRREEPEPPEVGRPVGFVGLGAMGLPMVVALVRAGHSVLACDVDVGRLSLAADSCGSGLHATTVVAELGMRCDVVLMMLPGSAEVAEVTGELAVTMAQGGLMVDLGESDPVETRVLAAALSGHGLRLIDAPAFGTPEQADAGTLAFMVGGTTADVATVQPYLRAMGSSATHTGDTGSAHEAARA
jgi:3-hydroxyisobutyrate dehydrogenase